MHKTLLFCIAGWFAAPLAAVFAALTPTELRCDNGTNPTGIDEPAPMLSWIVTSDTRGDRQTAYQILAASSPAKLDSDQSDLWDSGKVASAATGQIAYGGRALASSQQVFWKVRAWDKDGQHGPWSLLKPSPVPGQRSALVSWTMGILPEKEVSVEINIGGATPILQKGTLSYGGWQGARWIGAADAANPPDAKTLLLRRTFAVKPGLKRAVAHICGLGQYEMSVNGGGVNDGVLSPGWTDYKKTCLYDTLDITERLRPGEDNAAGLLLGNGMYNVVGEPGRYTKFKGTFGPLKAICLIRLEYEDGSVEFIGSDDKWRTAPGPITFSSIFGGEDYDARLVQEGWDKPGFDQSKWNAAALVDGPGGKLRGYSAAAPPIWMIDELSPSSPVEAKTLRPGVAVYDLEQNVSLLPRLYVRGPIGSSVRIIPAELLKPDGSVDRGSSGGGMAYWQYTLKQDQEPFLVMPPSSQFWQPAFFYHGCRYLQVECYPATEGGELPKINGIRGVIVHSSAPAVGDFSCSNELFNKIYELVRWAQRSNMMSVLTDCPHRERLGWLEQTHLNGPALRYNFDLGRLFAKTMNDMADAQHPDGLVPDIAPEYTPFKGGFLDSPEWGSAFLLVAWQQYEFNGDATLLARHYEGMKRYVDYLGTRAQEGIVSHGLGDWYDIGPKRPGVAQLTPIPLTATAFYFADADILAKAAKMLGKTDDAAKYGRLAGEIKEAFNKKFWDAEKGIYATGSQTANALPLVMGLAAPENRQRALDAIVKDVRERGNSITAGDVGYRYLLRALAEGGRSDVIFDMNNQSDKPGYGYQLAQGATSLTEAWNADRRSSQNHFMLGQIEEWFYHDLAGIGCDPAGPGFEKILIQPQPVGDVTEVNASYHSVRGEIVSEWQRDGGKFTLKTVIPVGSTATVRVPTRDAASVRESGQPAAQAPGVRQVRAEQGSVWYEVGSGEYKFAAEF